MATGPTPPRPVVDLRTMTPTLPDGWSEVILGPDGTVLAGWTTAGDFYAYTPTETIARTCMDAIREALTP